MYIPRIIEKIIRENLDTFKAIALVGPKFCGKTTLAEQYTKNSIALNPLNMNDYKTMLQLAPQDFLSGPYPKLIDEWQLIPEVWDIVRHYVDRVEGRGLFILTGSSAANFDETSHSGAGRIVRIMLRPMSLFEVGASTGDISLNALFEGQVFKAHKSRLTVAEYALWIIKGGWPESIGDNEQQSIRRMKSYMDALCKEDINKVTSKKYNELRVKKIMQSLARYTASETTNINILEDMRSLDDATAESTLIDYLDVLNKLYIIDDLKSWNPNLRSKTIIRSTPARFFVDPSIGASMLNLTTKRLMNDFKTFGLFFESLVVRDLRIYAESIDGEVFRYKDKNGLEIDTVIQLSDGRWGAIQIKMGSHLFDDAAAKLIRFAHKVDQATMGKPSFLAIISATEYGYIREDGVYVIPIGCLRE
ncbi:MAG TPA: AAA family ATPase [Clostridiales bacterium]|nr:AAA family ATPase [Clostridiales bacterium]